MSESNESHRFPTVKDNNRLNLADIINIEETQSLMDGLYKLTNVAFAIIDLDGKVLIATGWQEICTKFHRVHHETREYCIESDTIFSAGVEPGTFKIYKCKNNLYDTVTPITVEGKHVGNLFMGQFFFQDELPDYKLFRDQARKYGFDESNYLAALERVPRLNRETVHKIINFYTKIAFMISNLGHSNLMLARTLTERTLMEEAMQDRETRFRSLVENIPIGVYRVTPGPGGRILMANPACLKIFGIDGEEDFQKLGVVDLIVAESCKELSGALIKHEKVSGTELQLRKTDGTFIWGSVTARAGHDDSGNVVYFDCAIEDITWRKQAEEELKARDALLKKLSERVPGAIYQYRYFPDGKSCLPYTSEGIRDIFEVTPEEVHEDATVICERLHRDDYNGVLESILESFNTLQPWEYTFRVVLPKGGERWLNSRAVPDRLGDGSVLWHGFINDITDQKRIENEMSNRNEELTALYTLSTLMRTAKSSADLLPIVLDKAQSLLQADDGMVSLLAPDRKHITIAFGNGHWKDSVSKIFSAEEGLSGIVLRTEKTCVSDNYGAESQALPIACAAEIGPIVIVPMLSENELIGTLAVSRNFTSESRPFTPAEVRLLETIGEMAGNAMRRQRLHEDAQRRLRQTQALRNIDMAITGSLDLRVTYNVILDEITRQLNIDAAAVLRLEPHSMTLKYEAWRGFHTSDLATLRLRLGEGYAGRAVLNKQVCYIPDLSGAELDPLQGKYLANEAFCTYYAVPLIAKGQVQGALEVFHREKFDANEEWISFLDTLAGQTAIAIDNAAMFHNLERANIELVHSYDATIEGWAYALDLRDEATEGHSQRVTKMTLDLALQMGVKEDDLAYIRRGALLHDIGKMGIPDSILLKPGKLTDEEWKIMRKHPDYAYRMLSSVEYLRPALDIPYCHHEKWDGTGYPRGLKNKEIPLAARLFAVVDIYDALTSERPYRKAWSKEEALAYIREQKSKHFDPQVVEIFLEKNISAGSIG